MNGKAQFRLTHWGKKGPRPFRASTCPDPRAGELVELGELVSVVYLTEKGGDDGPTEYEHEFAKGARPVLAFSKQGLFICGGRYRVGVKGIHG